MSGGSKYMLDLSCSRERVKVSRTGYGGSSPSSLAGGNLTGIQRLLG